MRWLAILLAASPLICPGVALGWDFSIKGREFNLSLTDSFFYTYHWDNGDSSPDDDDYHQITNVLDLALSHSDFRLGGRFDLHLFADTPEKRLCVPGAARRPSWCGQRYLDHFVPERVYLVWARDEFDATLGDFYVSFGKGMALNVVKIDQLGQDTTIRGGKFQLHYRDLEVVFVGGEFNPVDTDEATGLRAEWRLEPVLGGRIEYRILDAVLLGGHGVYVISDDPNTSASGRSYTDHQAVWGAGLEIPKLWKDRLGLAVELDWQRTMSSGQVVRGPGAEKAGLAAYASASLHIKSITLLGEYKHYDRFRLEAPTPTSAAYTLLYSQPPTLERLEAEVYDNIGVSGGRLRLDWDAGTHGPFDLLAFVNFGYFQNWAFKEDRVFDPYGGIELRWQEEQGHLTLSGGARLEQERGSGATYHRDAHVELDVEQPIAARHSLKASLLYLRRQAQGLTADDLKEWNEADLAVSYRWSPSLSIGVTYERQEDPALAGGAENFVGGIAQYFITPGTYVSVRAGQNRPGIKCLNGICRYWPGFAGVQVSAVARF